MQSAVGGGGGGRKEEENKRYKQAYSFGVCIIAWIVTLELVFVVLLNLLQTVTSAVEQVL
jgi:hypothetical protein